MSEPSRSGTISLALARAAIHDPAAAHTACVLERGMLSVHLALRPPASPSTLSHHDQDEVYVIVRGSGVFLHGGRRDSFEPGDFLYVAAGVDHRFEDFTDDLTVWVIFYGPSGGEVPDPHPLQ